MNSRERVIAAINHEEPDRVPIDVGGTGLTGINLMAYGRLKRHLGLDGGKARVFHSWIQVPELEEVVRERVHSDCVTLPRYRMSLGIPNSDFKTWTHACGTEFLFPIDFNPSQNEEGDWEWHEHGEMIAKAPGEIDLPLKVTGTSRRVTGTPLPSRRLTALKLALISWLRT